MDTNAQHDLLEKPLGNWLSARLDFTFNYFADATKRLKLRRSTLSVPVFWSALSDVGWVKRSGFTFN
jgi:hypothetical protein